MKLRAFTLIELLVVIAIIAILAAILFPVFAKAKEAAKKAADVSNIKQANLGQVMYCSDNDDLFPGNTWPLAGGGTGAPLGWRESNYWGNNMPLGYNDPDGGNRFGYTPTQYKGVSVWARGLAPYLKNLDLMASPVDAAPVGSDWDWTGISGCGRVSYHMNGGVMGASQTQIPEVANMVLYRSHIVSHRIPYANPHFYLNGTTKAFATYLYLNDTTDGTFGEGSNIGWADGHVKYRKTGTLTWYELGSTNDDPKTIFQPGHYYYISQPWRGTPNF